MSARAAILRCGVHVPRLRLSRGAIADALAWTHPPGAKPSGSRAICNWDEDALTLGVEAARNCLRESARIAAQTVPRSLLFCSTTAPFADRDDAVLAAAALALPEDLRSVNPAGSLRAGTSGLIGALREAANEPVLVIASDARIAQPGSAQELAYGDAAAAVLIGPPQAGALATLIGSRSLASDFVDHYRMSGQSFDYALEERWVRDQSLLKLVPRAIGALLAAAEVPADAVAHLAVPAPAAAARRLAEIAGLGGARRDARVLEVCGDAGAAQPLLLLSAALESARPGEHIVLIGLGQGVDVLLLKVEDGVLEMDRSLERALGAGREETSYVRYLSHRGLIDIDFGMRAERDQRTAHTVAFRKRAAILGFEGGRCQACGTVQYPLARVCVNPACRATDRQTAHRLADSRGKVKTFTEDWQAYAARPPYIYGNVEFEEGGNLLMEFTDLESGELHVGDPVRFVFRIKDEDRARAFRRYFWKAAPRPVNAAEERGSADDHASAGGRAGPDGRASRVSTS